MLAFSDRQVLKLYMYSSSPKALQQAQATLNYCFTIYSHNIAVYEKSLLQATVFNVCMRTWIIFNL